MHKKSLKCLPIFMLSKKIFRFFFWNFFVRLYKVALAQLDRDIEHFESTLTAVQRRKVALLYHVKYLTKVVGERAKLWKTNSNNHFIFIKLLMLCFFPSIIQLNHNPTCFFIQIYTLYWINKRFIFLYHVRTIFWNRIWRGVVLRLLHRLKRFNLQETDKILGFRFLARQTDIRLRLQNFYAHRWK